MPHSGHAEGMPYFLPMPGGAYRKGGDCGGCEYNQQIVLIIPSDFLIYK